MLAVIITIALKFVLQNTLTERICLYIDWCQNFSYQGSSTETTDAAKCDPSLALQTINSLKFSGTHNRVLDLINVEVVSEIRYTPT